MRKAVSRLLELEAEIERLRGPALLAGNRLRDQGFSTARNRREEERAEAAYAADPDIIAYRAAVEAAQREWVE